MLTLDQALARVKRDTAPTSELEMTDDELRDCITDTARAKVWAANTNYQFDDKVITGNGRLYTCTLAGISSIEFPATLAKVAVGGNIVDGSARWKDAGPAYSEIYDVRAAICMAWTRKAGKVANAITFSQDGKRFELGELQDKCLRMARRFTPVVVA